MIDAQEIRRWFDIFHFDGDTTEIRLLGKGGRMKNLSGYFRDAESIITALSNIPDGYGIYSPINQIKAACWGRSQSNRLMEAKSTTSDGDIEGRRWILIDFDPKRPADTNSTEAEKKAAEAVMKRVAVFLRDQGFKSPVYADSANGYHLYYKVHLFNNEDVKTLVSNFLNAIELMFGNDAVDIDTSVFNAARIAKVIGTTSNKGSDTEDRPQRMSRFLKVPETIEVTDAVFIKKVAAMLPQEEKPSRENGYRRGAFDLDAFIAEHGIEVVRRVKFGQGEKLILKECPFDSNHKAPDAAIFRLNSGAVGFKCLHNSCAHYGWRDFRLHFDPTAYDRKTYAESRAKRDYYKPEPPKVKEETEEIGKKWQTMSDIQWKDPSEMVHIPTGITVLDKKIQGFALGDLTVISGLNSSGKTSLLNHFLLSAVQRNYKALVWSGEMQGWRFQNWIDQMAAGSNFVIKKDGYDNWYYVKPETAEKINGWIGDRLHLYNNDYGNRFSQLFVDIKEQVEKTGAKLVVVDNLMAIRLDTYEGDKNEQQSSFVQDIKDYAKKADIHIILVCHPRKEAGFQLLRKESIAGTADLTNTADNVFIIHRVGKDFTKRGEQFYGKGELETYSGYGNVIEVCKHRTTGLQDFLIGLYYDIPSKRFLNEVGEHVVYGWQEDDLPAEFCPEITANTEFDNKTDDGLPLPTIGDMPEFDSKPDLDDLPF